MAILNIFKFLMSLMVLVCFTFGESFVFAQSKDKTKKPADSKSKQIQPKDDTEDYIRCDEETYKIYSELRPKYLEIQRRIGEIDAKLKINEKNLDRLKEMSEEEIDKEVREENIKIIEEENSKLKLERKRLEEEGIEFYKKYEPIRHKCED